MSLVFGGTTVNNVIFNGTTIDRIVFNGVEVYTSGAPDGYLYLNGKTRSGWNAWVYNNYGGLVIEDSNPAGLPISYITVNAHVSLYSDIHISNAPSVQIRLMLGTASRVYQVAKFTEDYGPGYSGTLTIDNTVSNPNRYMISKIEMRPGFAREGTYVTITNVIYGLY